ncbi:MAG: hypothetical protein MOGMAGMI_01674 [Candidatus Omnitrophica bacterium]|nr:hypothetical protein [Candidatus Omnitrophota bacterium]
MKIRWAGVLFLLSSALVGFIVAPVYFYRHPLAAFDVALFLLYVVATLMAITVGYHRLYSHAAFRAHAIVRFLCLFFGAASFQQSALRWASLHRTHHRYVDTERDPYNIKRGFFYAHVGWVILRKPVIDYDNALDLQKDGMLTHQHRHYQLWALGAGVVLPLFLGALAGRLIETFLLTIAARLAVVHHCTFFINSFAHTFGTADYDPHSSAKDNWIGALLTNGEGYHNFHHRFPSDYRNGIRWYHWDPTKWLIRALSWVGLTSELRLTPAASIEQARAETRALRASKKI